MQPVGYGRRKRGPETHPTTFLAGAYKAGAVGATFSGWRQVSGAADGTGVVNISAIQLAVATMGPVAVGIDADSALHQFYHGGFFSGNCTFGTGILGRRTAPFPPFPYS